MKKSRLRCPRLPYGRGVLAAIFVAALSLVPIAAEARPKRSSTTPITEPLHRAESEKPLEPARVVLGDATALGIVIDTSGSMRELTTERLNASVTNQVFAILDANPRIAVLQLLDSDGRFIASSELWLPWNEETQTTLRRALEKHTIMSNSSPLPGMIRYLGALRAAPQPHHKVSHCVFGDGFLGDAKQGLERLNLLNPVQPNGERAVSIHAIVFPVPRSTATGRANPGPEFPPTDDHPFRDFMTRVVAAHNGSLVTLE